MTKLKETDLKKLLEDSSAFLLTNAIVKALGFSVLSDEEYSLGVSYNSELNILSSSDELTDELLDKASFFLIKATDIDTERTLEVI